MYLPEALKETLQAEYSGTVNGTVLFEENTITADFITEAAVNVTFLLKDPIEAKAENKMQVEEAYTTAKDSLYISGNPPLTFTATKDSLHIIRSYTLHEALAQLPDPLKSMVDITSPDFFVENPIQIRMSFAKVKPILLGDFDEDGTVGISDFLLFVDAFGSSRGDAEFDENIDLVPDGIINIADFLVFIDQFGKTGQV